MTFRNTGLRVGRAAGVAVGGQRRFAGFVQEHPVYNGGSYEPFRYRENSGRYMINSDTSFFDLMMVMYRLNRYRTTVEHKVAMFLENTLKNFGYMSVRCRAFNYSLYYFFALFHKVVCNLLYNVRLQPLIMNKLHTLLRSFHGGHIDEHKSIIRKPANFKYFWLWYSVHPNFGGETKQYDVWQWRKKCVAGEIKTPPKHNAHIYMKRRLLNSLEGKTGAEA
eukprot:Hpha_TRINITY_DN15355_c0_g5::TRINITY_DN15355_c0_g5_i1::g.87984::m.87984